MNKKADNRTKKPAAHKKSPAKTLAAVVPATTVKPVHAKATASVFVEGLSILCPNEQDKSVEIGFVREHHSGVKIEIYKNDCIRLASYTFSAEDRVKIEIGKSNPQSIGKCYENSKKDAEDYGWMPDLNDSDWHGAVKIGIKPDAAAHLSAKLVLRDAVFYAKVVSRSDGVRENVKTAAKKELGKVGRVLGADIFCETGDTDVNVTIETAGGTIIRHSLPKDGGSYSIVVETKPHSAASHLHLLYDYIVDLPAGEPKYEFKYKTTEPEWHLCETHALITEYACQTFGGGEGPLPPAYP